MCVILAILSLQVNVTKFGLTPIFSWCDRWPALWKHNHLMLIVFHLLSCKIQDIKNLFLRRKCKIYSGSSSLHPFWHFAKTNHNFASVFLTSSVFQQKQVLFNFNLTLDSSLNQFHFTRLRCCYSFSTISNSFMPTNDFSSKDVASLFL